MFFTFSLNSWAYLKLLEKNIKAKLRIILPFWEIFAINSTYIKIE